MRTTLTCTRAIARLAFASMLTPIPAAAQTELEALKQQLEEQRKILERQQKMLEEQQNVIERQYLDLYAVFYDIRNRTSGTYEPVTALNVPVNTTPAPGLNIRSFGGGMRLAF